MNSGLLSFTQDRFQRKQPNYVYMRKVTWTSEYSGLPEYSTHQEYLASFPLSCRDISQRSFTVEMSLCILAITITLQAVQVCNLIK